MSSLHAGHDPFWKGVTQGCDERAVLSDVDVTCVSSCTARPSHQRVRTTTVAPLPHDLARTALQGDQVV